MNRKTGARGLRSILEDTLLDVMYESPSREDIQKIVISKETVMDKLPPKMVITQEEKMDGKSKFVLIKRLILLRNINISLFSFIFHMHHPMNHGCVHQYCKKSICRKELANITQCLWV